MNNNITPDYIRGYRDAIDQITSRAMMDYEAISAHFDRQSDAEYQWSRLSESMALDDGSTAKPATNTPTQLQWSIRYRDEQHEVTAPNPWSAISDHFSRVIIISAHGSGNNATFTIQEPSRRYPTEVKIDRLFR